MKQFWGVLGTMLALVALYLLLEHAAGATGILAGLASTGVAVFGTLQGRSVTTSATGASSVQAQAA